MPFLRNRNRLDEHLFMSHYTEKSSLLRYSFRLCFLDLAVKIFWRIFCNWKDKSKYLFFYVFPVLVSGLISNQYMDGQSGPAWKNNNPQAHGPFRNIWTACYINNCKHILGGVISNGAVCLINQGPILSRVGLLKKERINGELCLFYFFIQLYTAENNDS